MAKNAKKQKNLKMSFAFKYVIVWANKLHTSFNILFLAIKTHVRLWEFCIRRNNEGI